MVSCCPRQWQAASLTAELEATPGQVDGELHSTSTKFTFTHRTEIPWDDGRIQWLQRLGRSLQHTNG